MKNNVVNYSKYYPNNSYNSTVKKARERLKECEEILESHIPSDALAFLPYDELATILAETEMLSLEIRAEMSKHQDNLVQYIDKENDKKIVMSENQFLKENGLKYSQEIEDKIVEKGFENYPVDIEIINKNLVKIYCPLTYKRGFKKYNNIDNYLLSYYLSARIKKYEEVNEIALMHTIKKPFICVMERVVKQFNIMKNCDADNIENQMIINVITKALSIPDNALNMSLYSILNEAKEDKKEGMYFYIFSQDDMEKYKELFKKT